MPKRGLWFVILACLHAGPLLAQDRTLFGPLPTAGDAAQRAPGVEENSLDAAALFGSARLPSTLERVDQPEPPLRLRGAREIELYRTLAPSVALIVSDIGQGSGALIAMKSLVAANRTGILLTNAHVVGEAREVAVVFKPQKDGEKVRRTLACNLVAQFSWCCDL